jgi:hypothetical protein
MRARAQQEEEIRGHPEDAVLLADLGLIDAGLGRREEALNEGRRAMELFSSVKNLYTEAYVRKSFAIICAWTGERELALGQLEALIKIPGSYTYGNFRLSPMWDPLRGDPLRKNRRLLSAERNTLQITPDFSKWRCARLRPGVTSGLARSHPRQTLVSAN